MHILTTLEYKFDVTLLRFTCQICQSDCQMIEAYVILNKLGPIISLHNILQLYSKI